ncbi:MAG TPA: sensor histidine kinase [Jatrophihabitantaceae bacterium]|jgi:signal transduction histidine kinase|nr:sensor histidine kinase [Jatrophihabitantaceae bacterium]
MGIWSPTEQPGTRSPQAWLFDVGVAVGTLVLSTAYVTASPKLSIPAAVAIIVALAAPLVVRRVWPVPVFGLQYVIAATTGWWAMQVVWSPALIVGLYTVAVLRPRRDASIAAGLLAVGAVVSSVHVFGAEWFSPAASLVAVVAAATALGLYIRTRRELLAQLRDRAERLERERDKQAVLAAEAERTRIARDMHDTVAHHLTVMVALSDGAAVHAATDPEQAADAMRAVSETGRGALAEIRRTLGVLRDDRPAPLAPSEVGDLDQLIDRVRATGLPVSYDVEGHLPPVGAETRLAVYRIVQEALTNTIKHGGAGVTASVRVRYGPDDVWIEVGDDGSGTAQAMPDGGRGLIGMRERIEALGGEFHSGPRDPRGWLVSGGIKVSSS